MNIVDKFLSLAQFEYPENQAGGIGRVSVSAHVSDSDTFLVELKSYGCNYNHPILINKHQMEAMFPKMMVESVDL